MDFAAQAIALGVDGWRWLCTTSRMERLVLEALKQRAEHHRETLDTNLAIRIAAEVSKLF